MRFLVDMFLSPRWVDFLVAAGHDAVHWVDAGEPNAPDRMILEHAHHNRLIILTQDLDFGTLLFAVGGLSTPSVIQFRAQAVLPSDVGRQLLAAIEVAGAHPFSVSLSVSGCHLVSRNPLIGNHSWGRLHA
jgi:predicted nuclease of predicted toxin-antitoxin system